VIGVVPVATLLKHPGIRFPAIVKVTRPATDAAALMVTDTPLETIAGTLRVTVTAAAELLVMVLVEIAAISLPARSIHRPPAAPESGLYANETVAPAGMIRERLSVATLAEKVVEDTVRALPLSEIV
jgi:hypothetical protein